jgi:hypothetical protein
LVVAGIPDVLADNEDEQNCRGFPWADHQDEQSYWGLPMADKSALAAKDLKRAP